MSGLKALFHPSQTLSPQDLFLLAECVGALCACHKFQTKKGEGVKNIFHNRQKKLKKKSVESWYQVRVGEKR